MRSNSKSTHVFEVRIWSRKHYDEPKKSKRETPIWNGIIRNKKHKDEKKFHSAGELLTILEKMYFEEEERARRN